MINSSFSVCRNAEFKIIAIIENTAISEMAAHSDGIHIYSKLRYREYNELEIIDCRAFCIEAAWTQTKYFSYKSAKRLAEIWGVPLILHDTTVHVGKPDCVLIGFE